MQGVGKTSLRIGLETKLREMGKEYVFSTKWASETDYTIWQPSEKANEDGFDKKCSRASYYRERLSYLIDQPKGDRARLKAYLEILSSFPREKIEYNARNVVKYRSIVITKDFLVEAVYENRCEELYAKFAKWKGSRSYLGGFMVECFGRDITENAEHDPRFQELVARNIKALGPTVVLLDFPDYNKTQKSRMTRDLHDVQILWENYYYSLILVLFLQKELFHNNFFFGKMQVYELKPFTPSEMVAIYKKKFNSAKPFTDEALLHLAALARGIFRRFLKYIGICLDNWFDSDYREIISVENVNTWITLQQRAMDMELELSDVFPNNRENQMSALKILDHLSLKNTPVFQKDIVDSIFEGNDMAASRTLDRLEAYRYLNREYDGKGKLVKLC